jgi:hypothetical protein
VQDAHVQVERWITGDRECRTDHAVVFRVWDAHIAVADLRRGKNEMFALMPWFILPAKP